VNRIEPVSEKAWWVYMIRTHDNQLYTGITTDMERRWHQHAQGKAGARYFRGRIPRELCLLEAHENRSSASKREAAIKQLNRAGKDQLLAQLGRTERKQLLQWNRKNSPPTAEQSPSP
jgi:putative endonuclease